MRIIVNGRLVEVRSGTLADLIDELHFNNPAIASALNEEFVSAAERPCRTLSEGDRVEILSARQGG